MNVVTKNYSNNYAIKDFIKNDIGAKYFDFEDINSLNVGVFGFLTDIEASQAEDTSNIISTYAREIFPNLAEIPESIYSYAGLYGTTKLFATPASTGIVLCVNEKDILSNGQRRGDSYEFFIDAATVIHVDGYDFSPDYDINITYRTYRDDLVFSAKYNTKFKNSLSDIHDPYIKIKRISFKGEKYVALILKVRRVKREDIIETLISNDKINLPKVVFRYNDQICNFEVLYRAPGDAIYTQLEKRFYMSEPLKTPFCYFRLSDTNNIELSFTTRDGSFQPKFNSELLIRVYTCNGTEDNFPLYKGDNITVLSAPFSEYEYNQNLTLFALIQTSSSGGTNMPTLSDIRELYLEKMVTNDSYTTENDLQIYFNKIKKILGNDIKFIKKRDDIFERLFASFSLMKDINGDIYHTNTLNLRIEDKSVLYDSGGAYMLKPGKTIEYFGDTRDTCQINTGLTLIDDPKDQNDFHYTNPFLIYAQKDPENTFYFYNSINDNLLLEYNYSNPDSYVQFICTSLNVYRNAILGDSSYKFRIDLNTSVDNYKAIVDENGLSTNILKVKIILPDIIGNDKCAVDLHLVKSDIIKHVYTFEGEIKTDDRININNEMSVLDVYDLDNQTISDCLISMNSSFKILTLFDYDNASTRNSFSHIKDIEAFTLTNIYTNNQEKKLNFMLPVANCRSTVGYEKKGDDFIINISGIPLVSTSIIKDSARFQYFVDNIKSQYEAVNSLMKNITNNYSIDMKLYNTYGRSNNFILGEDGSKLDRVNCGITFMVKPIIGADEVKLVANIKDLIKTFIENINLSGYNGIYISNLIKYLESNIPDISYLKFIKINNYDSLVQVIDNKDLNVYTASKSELKNYIPEFLTINISDINIGIISSSTNI